MQRLTFQLGAFAPLASAIHRFEKPTSFLVTMSSDIKCLGIAWVNDDVIYKELWLIEVVQQVPAFASVR
jgi:hypothetical protein